MVIWLVFLSTLGLLLSIYNSVPVKQKRIVFFFIAFSVIYFSGFRSGLGMDYDTYFDLCTRERILPYGEWVFMEPGFIWFTNYINQSTFTPILFFLITSIIINGAILYTYSKCSGFSIAVFFYICFPALFIMSFNIVRQFVVAAIFLLVSYLWYNNTTTKNKIIIRAVLIIVLLSMLFIHKSSIVLLPILFFGKRLISPIWATTILLISYIVPFANLPFIGQIISLIDALDYSYYLTYDTLTISKFSSANIYLNALTIILLFSIHKKLSQFEKVGINAKQRDFYTFAYFMVFLGAICNNLCSNGFNIMYRMAVYFIVFMPILIGILPRLVNRAFAYSLIIIPTLILIIFRFYIGDSLLIPDEILSFADLFKH